MLPGGLFQRSSSNPIITIRDLPYPANSVFNPAAVMFEGETLLMLRVEDMRGISHLAVARSRDGIADWRVDPEPGLRAAPDRHPEEVWGLEDPRITWLDEMQAYAVAYTAYGHRGPLVSLALTTDFRDFRRLGPMLHPEDKDAALFPRRFDGRHGPRWAMIHRPTPVRGSTAMSLAYSPDLRHWGELSVLLEPREGSWWDAEKIGLGPPPLETPEGWLLMYHGVHRTAAGSLYRVGLALLDLEDPRVVLRRSDEWVMGPTEPYEQTGDVGGVVFPCGWIHDKATDQLRVYYGAADTSVAVATATLSDVMAFLRGSPQPEQRQPRDHA